MEVPSQEVKWSFEYVFECTLGINLANTGNKPVAASVCAPELDDSNHGH